MNAIIPAHLNTPQMFNPPQVPNYFAIIPANVRYCRDLEANAKLLYGELTALCSKEGYCWASNKYFADLYEVETRTIQRWLGSLAECGFIDIQVIKGAAQSLRKIFLNGGFKKSPTHDKNVRGGVTKMSGGGDKNVTHSNTYSNTMNNTLMSDEDIGRPDNFSLENSRKNSLASELPPNNITYIISTTRFFYEMVRRLNPAITEKNDSILQKWAKVFDYMVRIDKRSIEDINKILKFIEWDHFNATGDFRWSTAVQSPEKLRKHFASIYQRMLNKPKEQVKREVENKKIDMLKSNKDLAELIIKKLKPEFQRLCFVSDHHISIKIPNDRHGRGLNIAYIENGFSDQLDNALRSYNMI